ncbi:MAG: ROK family protein [Verrucomicrobiota bacterium]|nr:ROK family protein [Verrucomicrobiota bacterium]
MDVLGIDIGGTGMKSAIVDTLTGELKTERLRYPTPGNGSPGEMADLIAKMVKELQWKGPVGCGFPGVIRNNVIFTAANLDKAWIGVNLATLIRQRTRCTAQAVNDADAAGMAEMAHGAGKNKKGTVFLITVGTGIGTALFVDGKLVPNTELGHIMLKGREAESIISDMARREKGLSWKQWSARFSSYLNYLDTLFWPDLYIIGGGGAKKPEKFLPYMDCRVKIVSATYKNRAGIIGAAMAGINNKATSGS